MSFILSLLTIGCGFAFGTFTLSQIIYPLFYSLPRAKRLEREGELTEPIPMRYFIVAPVTWSLVLIVSVLVVKGILPNLINLYLITLVGALVAVIVQIGTRNPDLEQDFNDTMGRFFKDP